METIKNGSKGEAVKTLLKALNLTADGVFGPKTEAAVKKFQSEHNLEADGIVGAKTWAALGIKEDLTKQTSKCVDPSVVYKPLSVHVSKLANRPIKYLAIHFTAGSNSKAGRALDSVYNTFLKRNASADFAVDDRDMVLFNPDLNNYYCWAVGDNKNKYSSGGLLYGKATNRNTISIEICSTCIPATLTAVSACNHTGWSFTEATYNNAVKLAKILIKKYNIPLENVVRHYDISGKLCPGLIGWNNETIYDVNTGKSTKNKSNSDEWLKFKDKLKS